ncbi:hypothetical protein KL86DPRO_20199 [uncultured delta proteobacterium]|uniref:Methyltransferase FkbM domain-containing protein n=1 Tax=uncultured delta proteobacterium TaxID=34034 RepID=A0A212JWI5_9DELT|nr:hypothetical protein KL86DPRO_20199 [uncultured delta proteobacterium]
MFANNIFRQIERTCSLMERTGIIQCIRGEAVAPLLCEHARYWADKNSPANADSIEALVLTALSQMYWYGSVRPTALYNVTLFKILKACSLFSFEVNGKPIVYCPDSDTSVVTHIASCINGALKPVCSATVYVENAPKNAIIQLREQIAEARKYYIDEHGAWVEQFMQKLGDDVSRFSYESFLRQRIKAHACWAMPTLEVNPPAQRTQWLQERALQHYELPTLEGAGLMLDFLHRTIYILDQYSLPGKVEAKPGDVVIDAGAAFGETAIYFSRKTNNTGRVFAFEPVPETAGFARRNAECNGCVNVTVIEKALSDVTGLLHFSANELFPTAARATTSTDSSSVDVHSITLDAFAAEKNIKIDFIKADVEGSEMNLLRGAEATIKRDAPTIAMSLYHLQDDYHAIPKYLMSLRDDYTFYFRSDAEPVLLAVVE